MNANNIRIYESERIKLNYNPIKILGSGSFKDCQQIEIISIEKGEEYLQDLLITHKLQNSQRKYKYLVLGTFKDPIASKTYFEAHKIVSQFKSPYILTIYDVNGNQSSKESNISNNESPLQLLMEYAPHGDLKSFCENECLSIEQILKLNLQILCGLITLEENHMNHLDIKIQNILICDDNTEEGKVIAKISDFDYLSRVQLAIDNKQIQQNYYCKQDLLTQFLLPNSDVYAFGIILYKCLYFSGYIKENNELYFRNEFYTIHGIERLFPPCSFFNDNPDIDIFLRHITHRYNRYRWFASNAIYSNIFQRTIINNDMSISIYDLVETETNQKYKLLSKSQSILSTENNQKLADTFTDEILIKNSNPFLYADPSQLVVFNEQTKQFSSISSQYL
ncbi:hypothetical protein WA158_006707 [Blastocystis sp. Blastoise]